MKLVLILVLAILGLSQAVPSRDRNNKPYKMVCYFGSWAFWRPERGKVVPDNIDPNICTHIVYGFATLDRWNYVMKVFEPDVDINKGNYQKFLDLRKQNTHLTALIAVGGWGDGSLRYSRMVADAAKRKTFVDSVLAFLHQYDFDGLDLDWEFPGTKEVREGAGPDDLDGQTRVPSGNKEDKPNHLLLLKELRAALDPHGYMLSAAVSPGKPTIDDAYEVAEISKGLDIINLMTYDFHGAWENVTGHNAPLYINKDDNDGDRQFTVEYAVDYWIQNGADRKKIVMGMPLYGRSFKISGSDQGFHTKTVPNSNGGSPGPYTRQEGVLGYNEYCESRSEWTEHWVEAAGVPYAVKGDNWLGFDNPRSLKLKVDYLKKQGLGGGMVWSLETDDLFGHCGTKWPLMTAINEALFSDTTPSPGPNPDPTTPGPNPGPTTPAPGPDFKCPGIGIFGDPSNPHIYHECADDGAGGFHDYVFECPAGTRFNDKIKTCEHEG